MHSAGLEAANRSVCVVGGRCEPMARTATASPGSEITHAVDHVSSKGAQAPSSIIKGDVPAGATSRYA